MALDLQKMKTMYISEGKISKTKLDLLFKYTEINTRKLLKRCALAVAMYPSTDSIIWQQVV